MPRYKEPSERFWPRVDKDGAGGCWLWTGAKDPLGYGRFGTGKYAKSKLIDKPFRLAHRFAYENMIGPIADGMVIDHLCKIPSCVNPAHLEPVTQKENVRRGSSAQKG